MLFYKNPDLFHSFNSYVRQNLDTLSAKNIHKFLFEKAFPELLRNINENRSEGEVEVTVNMLLAESMLKCLSISTIHNWMRQLGFKYEVRKKTYYVDSHEKTGNVIYWVNFIQCYFGYELQAH
jgi:hypothetical protein